MLSREAVQETKGLFIQASMPRASEDVAEPGIFASSLDGELQETVEGICSRGPEQCCKVLDSRVFLHRQRIVEDRTAAANWTKLPSISRCHYVETSERTLDASVS